MSPDAIPWLLCGALCLFPLCVGFGAFQLLGLITNRHYQLDLSVHVDEDGIKHVHSELTWLTREELKLRNKKEVEE